MPKERHEIDTKDTWNLTHLFKSVEAWEAAFTDILKEKTDDAFWPSLSKEQHDLQTAEGVKVLLESLTAKERQLTNLYIYAFLWHDEDVAREESKTAYEKSGMLFYRFGEEVSWIRPALIEISDTVLADPALAPYDMYLRKVRDLKPFTLPDDKEALLSLAAKPLSTPQQSFSAFNNADLQFEAAETEAGEKKPLSHGTFSLYLQSADRTLRKTAFERLHSGFHQFENTLTELLHGHVQTHLLSARARGYDTCLHNALQRHNIDPTVYTTLIESTKANLEPLHTYISLRKSLLGYETLHAYDLHVPLSNNDNVTYTYDEAVALVLESVAPLGDEYVSVLKKGLTEDRWVDKYENARKRSGAYSCSSYDSPPYILLNFQGTLRDVMTLAHEAGHSMHSYFSNKTQPFHDAQYPIFVAEVASTFNEELVFRTLLEKAATDEARSALLNRKIDDIRSTFYRQVQFAEFELELHSMAERGEPFTATGLKKRYAALNEAYYGPAFTADDLGAVEFMRVPHFYSNFYVYQYATGICAAHALVERVLQEGEVARKEYLTFLSSGGSQYPLDLLRQAGVDMQKPAPTEKMIAHFEALTTQLSGLSEKVAKNG